jgi:hypothetical protein
MRADLLHVFVAYANPMRWRSRLHNYLRFEQELLPSGVNLTTVEIVYRDRVPELPPSYPVKRITLVARDALWHKENALMVAAAHTPGWQYAATIDADFQFADRNWAVETVQALQLHPVVQISSELISLGPDGQHLGRASSVMELRRSYRWNQRQHGPPRRHHKHYDLSHGYPGGAWAYRRDAWDALGGLLDRCIVGAGDHHMARALIEFPNPGEPLNLSTRYDEYILHWQTRAHRVIGPHAGLVPGLALHYWHGKSVDRGYMSRPQILRAHEYDPGGDVIYDAAGLLQLAGNKPELRADLLDYFQRRREDDTEL